METFDECSKPSCTNCLVKSGVVSNLYEFKLYLKPAKDIDVNKVAQDPNSIPAKFLFSKPSACDCAEKKSRQQEEKSNRVHKDYRTSTNFKTNFSPFNPNLANVTSIPTSKKKQLSLWSKVRHPDV
ncbi:hypothetical protein NPIL_42591 [Nephila pilipes]|uniref:Uncharacterized protein n=1 Tax=Nephila pilipes TaxID=299642 RepID=A0A8X6U3N5_NEPPI|nr:hypothetical protein NPIL_42591 [Nephila pilipes]